MPNSGIKSKVFFSGRSVKPRQKTSLAAPPPKVAEPVQTEPQPNPDAKVAIISCCYGGYEATTKPVVEQSVPCDKIFFTDNPNINNCGNWIIDTTPYHLTHNKYLDTDYTNSWKNNKSSHMIGKYYKAQFMDIPRLQKYDYVLVIDGTIEITNKDCVKMLIEKIAKENTDMVCWMQTVLNGYIVTTVPYSIKRWAKESHRNASQPYQDINEQYEFYIRNGFSTKYWQEKNIHKNYGTFHGGFLLYKINDKSKKFLNSWYEEILKWTTQDEISLTYVLQMLHKENDYKFSVVPDDLIKGDLLSKSNVHIRHSHGK